MHLGMRKVRAILLPLTIAIMLTTASAYGQGSTTPSGQSDGATRKPYCTNRGAPVEQGQTACLTVNGAALIARCGMVLNNPSWEWSATACPDQPPSSRPQ